jgi:hypothetical protein
MVVGSIRAFNHGGRARILYLGWYANPGNAADQPGVQEWYIPCKLFCTFTNHCQVPILLILTCSDDIRVADHLSDVADPSGY